MASNVAKMAWKTYGLWAGWVGIAFFAVYPSCNWLTSLRQNLHPMYLNLELGIPFVPEFIWIYLSMYLLFLAPPFFLDPPQLRSLGKRLVAATLVAGGIFLLLPATLGFTRTVPDIPFYGTLYQRIFTVDMPHNLVPSLHVVFSALILFSIIQTSKMPIARIALWGWLLLLCVSTLLVHQHHLLDVAAGLTLAMLFDHLIGHGENHV